MVNHDITWARMG